MPSEMPSNATKIHLHGVVYPLPQRIFTFLAKTPQTANKYTYIKQENKAKHRSTHNTTRPQRQKTRQNNVRKQHRSGKEKHTEKHTQKHGQMFKMSYPRACACACSFLQSSRPTYNDYIKILLSPPFSLPARACVVRACTAVQWWYVAMCFCVWWV